LGQVLLRNALHAPPLQGVLAADHSRLAHAGCGTLVHLGQVVLSCAAACGRCRVHVTG
jgi:hypothetical protein